MNTRIHKDDFDGSLKLGAKKFYTATGRGKFVKKRQEKAPTYYDVSKNAIKASQARYRKCICGVEDYSLCFVKDGFNHVICNKCEFLYVNPILSPQAQAEFYKRDSNWKIVLENKTQQRMDELKFRYGLKHIERHISGRTLLDIGCGYGHFVEVATKQGWDALGTELNEAEVKHAREKGRKVIDLDVHSKYFDPLKFDAITMWEVLEHLSDPIGMLQRCYKLLSPRGVLFILVPNKDSFLNRAMREESQSFSGQSHLQFFNAESLGRALRKSGFDVLRNETIVSQIGQIRNYLSYQDAYTGQSSENFRWLTSTFIHKNMLGCKLLTVARRIP